MRLTRTNRIIVALAGLAIFLLLLFPPWRVTETKLLARFDTPWGSDNVPYAAAGGTATHSWFKGHRFILSRGRVESRLYYAVRTIDVDTKRLTIEVLAVAVAATTIAVLVRPPKRRNEHQPDKDA